MSENEQQGREDLALTRLAPDWERVKSLVLDGLPSPHSRRVYAKALDEFRLWAAQAGAEGFTKATVRRDRTHLEALALAPSTINVRLTGIRKLAQEAADNGLLNPELAAVIGRVKGAPQKGRRLGNWLNREQASDLLNGCHGDTLKELRDRALLCLLVGCGLRRGGVALEQIQLSLGHDSILTTEKYLGIRQNLTDVPATISVSPSIEIPAPALSLPAYEVLYIGVSRHYCRYAVV